MTELYKGYQITIEHTDCFENPRMSKGNMTVMACFHGKYSLGDELGYDYADFDGWEDFKSQLEKDYCIKRIKPLYLYDHSGITISTEPFNDPWDSGQVGWVFTVDEGVTEDIMLAEVQEYDYYLRGEAYHSCVIDCISQPIEDIGGLWVGDRDKFLESIKKEIDIIETRYE